MILELKFDLQKIIIWNNFGIVKVAITKILSYINQFQWNIITKILRTGLDGVFCKSLVCCFLHDHFDPMVIPGPFQKQFKNNYLIFKPNHFITRREKKVK
jgi:hypothetical protein